VSRSMQSKWWWTAKALTVASPTLAEAQRPWWNKNLHFTSILHTIFLGVPMQFKYSLYVSLIINNDSHRKSNE
jgi:hypothetical protein